MAAPHYGFTGTDDPPVRDSVHWEWPVQALPPPPPPLAQGAGGGGDDAGGPTLSDAQVRRWHEQRFLVIDGVWPAGLIAEVRALPAMNSRRRGSGAAVQIH
jgi:hypothetical protein|eukprot:SAG25_NODE_867_length_5007_cov_2.816218_4_plen_101_part_00